jgi:hypothetical protein
MDAAPMADPLDGAAWARGPPREVTRGRGWGDGGDDGDDGREPGLPAEPAHDHMDREDYLLGIGCGGSSGEDGEQ